MTDIFRDRKQLDALKWQSPRRKQKTPPSRKLGGVSRIKLYKRTLLPVAHELQQEGEHIDEVEIETQDRKSVV